MKRTIYFVLFLAFAACKNTEPPQVPPVVAPQGEWVTDTFLKTIELPYTRVKAGKRWTVARLMALDYFRRHNETVNPETQDYFDAMVKEIHDLTLMEPHGDDPATPDRALTFESYKGKLYMEYITNTLAYSIPLELVKPYLE